MLNSLFEKVKNYFNHPYPLYETKNKKVIFIQITILIFLFILSYVFLKQPYNRFVSFIFVLPLYKYIVVALTLFIFMYAGYGFVQATTNKPNYTFYDFIKPSLGKKSYLFKSNAK